MTAIFGVWSELSVLYRLLRGLGPYLRRPFTPAECRRRAREGLERRSEAFLATIRQGVLEVSSSPYRRLLEHAGVGLPELRRSVAEHGVEGTLSELHGAGVYLTLDEFKGRRPIVRDGLVLEARSRDFDNPLTARQFATETGGSRSTGTRIYVDLDHYARDAIYDYLFRDAFGLLSRPLGSWRPVPPYGAGIKSHMSRAKLGVRDVRWFSQSRLRFLSPAWKHAALTEMLFLGSRAIGRPLRRPEHVPLSEPWRVAEWLEECRNRGTPGFLNTNCSSAVRVATAALERGIDISGSFFRLGGEPFTEAKAEVIRSAGARACCHYSMGETGRIGLACASPAALDDVHILEDKMAVIEKPRSGGSGEPVPVNVYTTILPTTPKIMLNVESDDHGVLARRSCGCPLGELGYDLHLHGIRSWEKLTSEGMNFLGADLLRLVEEVLPSAFGGSPIDYQFLEEEEGGLPRVTLLVSPGVGTIDEDAVSEVVLDFLDSASGGGASYGDRWREAETLRVRRQEPIATRASKVLALHTTRKKPESA